MTAGRASRHRRERVGLRLGACLLGFVAACQAAVVARAESPAPPETVVVVEPSDAQERVATLPIDLPATLALAGAQSPEIQRARLQIAESRGRLEQTRARFFPWVEPTVGYRRHEGRLQDVVGTLIDTDKQAYDVGAAVVAEIDFGRAIFDALAARRRLEAARHASEAERQATLARAAGAYLELARAEGAVRVAEESERIALDYAGQLERAADIGLAFRGDVHRARVRVERNRQLLATARGDRRVAAARLAETLDLDPAVDLHVTAPELAVWQLVDPSAQTEAALIERALARRPEAAGTRSSREAAVADHDAARLGPWLPTLGARARFYGLGGGEGDAVGRFGDGQDYGLDLRWRIGPGGLLDPTRDRAAAARAQLAELDHGRTLDRIRREVVEALARARTLADQYAMGERMLEAAEEALRLSRERRAFGIGAVLETLAAEEELTRARLDFVALVAELNRAQLELQRAIGEAPASESGSDVIPRS